MTEHVIECNICHAREYVETLPEVWFCKHLAPQVGKKWWICGNCQRGHYVDSIEWAPKCPDCEKARETQVHGWIKDFGAKRQEIVHEPTLAELAKRLKAELKN